MPAHDSAGRFQLVLYYAAVLLLGYLVFGIFRPFLVPLGWAGVFVILFYPWHTRLERRWGSGRAAGLSTLLVTLILVVPAILVTTAFVREAIDAAQRMQEMQEGQASWTVHLQRGWGWLQQRIPVPPEFDPRLVVREGAERIGGLIASRAGAVLRNVATFFFDFFVFVFAMFFLFRDAPGIVDGLRRLLPFDEAHRTRALNEGRDLIFASVTASLVIALVQGLFGGAAFALLGIGSPIFSVK